MWQPFFYSDSRDGPGDLLMNHGTFQLKNGPVSIQGVGGRRANDVQGPSINHADVRSGRDCAKVEPFSAFARRGSGHFLDEKPVSSSTAKNSGRRVLFSLSAHGRDQGQKQVLSSRSAAFFCTISLSMVDLFMVRAGVRPFSRGSLPRHIQMPSLFISSVR